MEWTGGVGGREIESFTGRKKQTTRRVGFAGPESKWTPFSGLFRSPVDQSTPARSRHVRLSPLSMNKIDDGKRGGNVAREGFVENLSNNLILYFSPGKGNRLKIS